MLAGIAGAAAVAGQWGGPQAVAAPAPPASEGETPLSLTLLGTNGGPPPQAARYGISSALVVNGRTYVVDCGRGAVSQYMRAGLSMSSLAGIFLTHLHADHVVDYYAFPMLSAGAANAGGFRSPIEVHGPGPAGLDSTVSLAPGPVPG
ncbi:MBL fold metallo-hydrolase, partial [Streptomyces sp. TRM76130]|nr:MBL fold metallo-hydrolase [Streptomyces sp. TRM76130]